MVFFIINFVSVQFDVTLELVVVAITVIVGVNEYSVGIKIL